MPTHVLPQKIIASLRHAAVAIVLSLMVLPPPRASAKGAVAPGAQGPGPTAAVAAAIAPAYTAFYGVYVGGSKVGFMRACLEHGPTSRLSYRLEAQVRGMGRTTPVVVEESRDYGKDGGLLQSLSFRQAADSGSMTVECQRRGRALMCTTTAGGAQHESSAEAQETLADALAQHALVTAPKALVGDTRKAKHFDPQAQTMTEVKLHIDAIDERLTAGVKSRIFTVTSHYPAMGVKEQSTFTDGGVLVATHMGGFFEVRLEPENVAKKLDLAQDVLMQAVVRAPLTLSHPENLQSLTLTMAGFDDAVPPASLRQQVRRLPQKSEGHTQSTQAAAPGQTLWQLTMHKDAPLPPLPFPGAPQEPVLREVKEALKPTAFIQSTAKDITQAAQKAVHGAKTMPQAIAQLVDFVQGHLRPEYVPAFSNALEALHARRGDCTEYSVLFVALARAVGIPARVAVGVAYWPPGQGFGWHAWAEVFVDGRWVSVDPTWGQTISDVTHLKFAEGGPTEQARLVMLLGRLRIDSMQPN